MIHGANSTVSIFQIDHNTSTNTYPGSADTTGVEAFIEAQNSEVQSVLGQGYNVEVYLMHCDPVTIDVGDKVVDQNSVEYRVASVERHENNTDTEDVYTVTLHKQRSTT